MNPDLTIATLTDPAANFEMDVWVAQGRGYRSTEERVKEKLELGTIAVDALYNPVQSVSYKVEATRVGEKTDFDKLVLRIETDGTVDALDALNQSVKILLDYANLLQDLTYSQE
jgi:DNA-directed RNA polymerase subunit alpha